jgi:hypothetical protein
MTVAENDDDADSGNYVRALCSVEDGRFNRFTVGFDGTSDGATSSPVIYAETFVWNPLAAERII